MLTSKDIERNQIMDEEYGHHDCRVANAAVRGLEWELYRTQIKLPNRNYAHGHSFEEWREARREGHI